MIRTTDELADELDKLKRKYKNNVITVMLNDREYVIENVCHITDYGDGYSSHLCLNIRHGGDGNIKR